MGLVEAMEETEMEETKAQGEHGLMNGAASAAATAAVDGVRAFDEQGRQVMVPRDEWRKNVIPGMLREAWNDPNQLYLLILNSLNDGFVVEMAEAAEHLHEIDTIPGRGACMWGIVLLETGRVDEAEALLAGFAAKHGEDASVLVNLAKVYAARGEMERARETVGRALEVEPNHDNALGWYAALEQERGGEAAVEALLQRIAAMPQSWRAHAWLGRGELNGGNAAKAMELYREAMSRAPRPVPPDLLMQISGDLGQKGLLAELVEITAPNFVPEWHGIPVGNNLIKALADAGRLNEAEQVKATLWALNRPDWKEALAFWDAEIARRRLGGMSVGAGVQSEAQSAAQAQELQVGMLRIDGPIWLPPGSPARKMFSAKSASAPSVTFLGGTAEAPASAGGNQPRMGDAIGRMTRSLPLFFAEQVEMRTAAAGRAMLPWAVAPVSGFVVSGRQWPDETAVQAVQVPEHASDYVVSVHLDAEVEPWTAMLAFVRTHDGVRIGELEREFPPAQPELGLAELGDEVVELLSVLGPATDSPAYLVPGPETFGAYLLQLEQLLAVRCASMDRVPPTFLSGEQAILEGEFELCRAEPGNLPARLLLQSTLQGLEEVKPETVSAFAGRFAQLQEEYPLGI